MTALREKLFFLSAHRVNVCSNKAAWLQDYGSCRQPVAKFFSVTTFRKNAILVPAPWLNKYQKLSPKNYASYNVLSWPCERRSGMKSVNFLQCRKKNILTQPVNLETKDPVKKLQGPSQISCEGPVLHHCAAAALVATCNRNDHATEELHYDKVAGTVNNLEMSEQSAEALLACTTARVKKISASDEWDFYLQNSKSPDIEYVVEQDSTFSAKPKVKLTGALPSSARDWRTMEWNLADLPSIYAALAKSRLTGLVVATALGGYVLAPAPLCLATLVGSVAGTGLVSAAANATNQVLEVPYDAQMSRTANRALVRGIVSPLHAACFASTCGVGGLGLLLGLCGPAAAGLGLLNLALYTACYTPLKRRTIANTWVGALVGAIPPLIGWCGCGGPLIGAEAWGAWLMATLLFAWQFPHFNALSWNLRADYSKAGYRMMCVTDPRLCRVTCVRYSTVLLLLSFAAPALSVTTWTFAVDSAPLNAYMLYLSYRFYKDGDSRSARNLFRFSLLHLPAVMVLLLISKKWRNAASENASPIPYAANVVYNKAFQGHTVPTIVAATAQTGVHCVEIDSKLPEASLSADRKLEENLTQGVAGTAPLTHELLQEMVSSSLNGDTNSLTAPKEPHFSKKVDKNASLATESEDINGKTMRDVSAENILR